MKKAALAVTLAAALAGCGAHPSHHTPPHATLGCPQAANGHGSLGACAPKQKLGLTAPRTVTGQPTYPDRSNNDPCYCGAAIRAQGQAGLIVKANQGVGFIDRTAVAMVQSARSAGLAVGEYDFDQDYTVAEARVFVARLHAAGIYPRTPNTFPAYFDVEYGRFSLGGLRAQVAYVRSLGYRVGIYTGAWYWTPHAGCTWIAGVSAWLSGYPNAPVPCGTTGYNAHQFTSTPVDLSVFLGSRAQFETFVNAAPSRPVCFGPHAQLRNATCQRVRPEVAGWSRERDATARSLARVRGGLAANHCRTPYRRDVCVDLGREIIPPLLKRERYFAGKVAATIKAYS